MIGVVEGIDGAARMNGNSGRSGRHWGRYDRRGNNRSWWSFEWESPEASTLLFPPSFEDAVALRIKNSNIRFGKDDFAILVSKRAQTDEGVGK